MFGSHRLHFMLVNLYLPRRDGVDAGLPCRFPGGYISQLNVKQYELGVVFPCPQGKSRVSRIYCASFMMCLQLSYLVYLPNVVEKSQQQVHTPMLRSTKNKLCPCSTSHVCRNQACRMSARQYPTNYHVIHLVPNLGQDVTCTKSYSAR